MHDRAEIVEQAEVLAAAAELEVGVQVAVAVEVRVLGLGHGLATVGREDHAELARAQRYARERPRVAAVLERPAGQVGRLGAEVVYLEPVGVLPVPVKQPAVVDSQKLADHDVGSQHEPRLEWFKQCACR